LAEYEYTSYFPMESVFCIINCIIREHCIRHPVTSFALLIAHNISLFRRNNITMRDSHCRLHRKTQSLLLKYLSCAIWHSLLALGLAYTLLFLTQLLSVNLPRQRPLTFLVSSHISASFYLRLSRRRMCNSVADCVIAWSFMFINLFARDIIEMSSTFYWWEFIHFYLLLQRRTR
jgi:hypothetical protein